MHGKMWREPLERFFFAYNQGKHFVNQLHSHVPILWDTTPQNQVDQLINLNMVAIYPQLIQTRQKTQLFRKMMR